MGLLAPLRLDVVVKGEVCTREGGREGGRVRGEDGIGTLDMTIPHLDNGT
jgi:hypothetical protein